MCRYEGCLKARKKREVIRVYLNKNKEIAGALKINRIKAIKKVIDSLNIFSFLTKRIASLSDLAG